MRDHPFVKIIEKYIKDQLADTLLISPVNSMTPFVVKREDSDKEEYLFVCKCESWIYEPLQGKNINSKTSIGAKSYFEDENLIFGFNVDPDINLETEILKDKVKGFLERLYKQDNLTIAVIDHMTMNVVWIVHYPFENVKDEFNPLFEQYGVI